MRLDLPLTALAPGAPLEQRLLVDAGLGGSVADPTVDGSVTLDGALAATGDLAYRAGAGQLRLSGPELDLLATLAGGDVTAQAAVRGLALDGWLPQLPGGRLAFDARLTGSRVSLTDLALTAPGSRLTGAATVDLAPASGGPTLRSTLEANVDLASLALGDLELTGQLRGPVIVSASDLGRPGDAAVIANLAALRLGVAGVAGSVSGNLTLGGRLADPSLNLQLVGDGAVRGSLLVDARPVSGEIMVRSDLEVGALATDLRVGLSDRQVNARGSLRYGEAIALLDAAPAGADATAARELVITGAGRLTGLAARVAADLGRAEVSGSLGGLGAGLRGDLHLVLGGAEGWLSGTLADVALAGVELGTLTAVAAAPTAPVRLIGDGVRVTVEPLGLAWQAEVAGRALGAAPGAPRLQLSGSGVGASGSLTAGLSGEELDLRLSLRHEDATSLTLEGRAYGGEVLLVGDRAAGGAWEGGGYYDGGRLGGLELSASADLLGDDLLPQLVLRTRAADGFVVEGSAALGPAGVSVDQLVQGGPFTQALRVQGRLLPTTEVTLSSLEVAPGASLSPSALAEATTSSVRLASAPDPEAPAATSLRADGDLAVAVGPVTLRVAGANEPPELGVELFGLPGWRLATRLAAADLPALVTQVVSHGLQLEGQEALQGRVHLDPASLSATLDGFGLAFAGLDLAAAGRLGLDHADVNGALTFATDLPVAERETGYRLPWRLTNDAGAWLLVSDGPQGRLEARYDQAGDLAVSADLAFSEGRVVGQLGLTAAGLSGTLDVDGVRLLSPELGGVTIDVEAAIADGRVGGSGTLESDAGRLTLSGSWGLGGLLPTAIVPGAPTGGRLEARLRTLELSQVPAVARLVPHLSGEVSGVAQLRDGFLLGQFVAPELDAGGLTSPMQLTFNGTPAEVEVSLQLRGALGNARLAGGRLGGTVRFERFPLNLLATAVVGPSDYTADLTGVMRVDVPLADPLAGYLRVATEEVRLERMGVPTVGNVSVTFEERALLVERAEFEGRGSWAAGGVLRPDLFDFRLEAQDADFTPLLGLVPGLARLGVGAAGSFDVTIGGNAAHPSASLASPELEVEVAGTRYRLEGTEASLEGVDLALSSRLHGLSPVTGTLDLAGGAHLSLFPFALRDTDVAVSGAAQLSGFGRLTNVTGALRQERDGPPTVQLTGLMGSQPLTVEGSLDPLELRASGRGVTMALPSLLVAEAVVDADLRLTTEAGGVVLGGSVVADEVTLDPAVRTPVAPAPAGGDEAAPEEEALAGVEAAPTPAAAPSRGGLAALRFDDLAIQAPGRVVLATNVGSFEAALDLTLSGTGADPRLAGSATALRGSLRFSGREFTVDRAVATFSPNRGVFPELDVVARTEFDKARVLAAAPSVSFAAPREGGTFEVVLAFTGPVEPAQTGGFRFDVRPLLTSDALLEVPGEAMGGAVRPFTEAELMSLITLGRFELNADLIGAGGLGEAVAQGALDTAVDLLVVSGLESALREALGLDVVEIRTSAVSSLLEEGGQPFGVSVRVGGYLNPELFASYRIGTYDGGDPSFGLTNEVLLRYALGPLDLDLIGRLDFPTAGTLAAPRPEIGVLLGYQFTPYLGIDGGVTLGTQRSRLEFGVTLRW